MNPKEEGCLVVSPSQITQTATVRTVFFVEFDTAPPIQQQLLDGAGDPIDLTGASVTISIAFAMPRGTYYTSPRDQIVKRSPVTVDPDQTEGGRRGWISWTPGAQGDDDALTPPGQFLFTLEVTYPDGTKQTIPSNTYSTLVIKTPVGGRSLNI